MCKVSHDIIISFCINFRKMIPLPNGKSVALLYYPPDTEDLTFGIYDLAKNKIVRFVQDVLVGTYFNGRLHKRCLWTHDTHMLSSNCMLCCLFYSLNIIKVMHVMGHCVWRMFDLLLTVLTIEGCGSLTVQVYHRYNMYRPSKRPDPIVEKLDSNFKLDLCDKNNLQIN